MTNEKHAAANTTPIASRVGYAIAVGVNLVLLFVVNNLLAWGWVPFLTEDFERLLPIVDLSLVVGAGVNVAFIFYNAPWFRSVGQIVQNAVSILVIIATLKIFPFDFSPYSFDWATFARTGLILVGVAIGIGTIVEVVKLVRAAFPGDIQDSRPG